MLVAPGADDPNWYKASVTTTAPDGNGATRHYQGSAAGVRLVGQSKATFWAKFKEELNADLLPAYIEDFKGNRTSYQWNANRQLITKVVAASNRTEAQSTQIDWHDTLALPTLITETGRTTKLSYGGGGRLVGAALTDNASNTTYSSAWSYNAQGLPGGYTDAAGQTLFGYDTRGNRNKVTNALGHVHQFAHDGAGRILTAMAPSGLERSYSYNPRGQLTRVSVGGQQTTLTYLPNDRLGTITFANGPAVTYQYDGALRVNRWSDNRGNSGNYALDAQDNVISAVFKDSSAATALQVQLTINNLNKVASETIGGNQSTALTYDANGDLATARDGLGQTTTLQVDGLRRLTKVTDPLNASATLSYNALDAVTSAQDFKGVTTTYTRDALGRPTQLQYGSTATSTLRYDLPGNTYNGPAAPKASTGHLSEIQDPGVTTQYQRDILGRVLRKSQILTNGDTRSLIHSYVPAGQGGGGELQSITYPSGKQATYLYDSTGQITGLQ
ncbi:hypothetical protein CTI10_022030, partial [Delftia acidovorans]